MKFYKFLTSAGNSTYQGFSWPLPDGDNPGLWVEVEGDLVKCENGLHAALESNLVPWIGALLFEMEFDGEVEQDDEKVWGRRARLVREVTTWNARTQRLFACDCAERVANLGNEEVNRATIEVSRRFANGEATETELAAALGAARDAVWAAARDAERHWQNKRILQYINGEVQ